jgi:hypothetical protein
MTVTLRGYWLYSEVRLPCHSIGGVHELKLQLPKQAITLLATLPKKNKYVFGGVLTNWDRATKKLFAASQTMGWHRHDLRRTVASGFGQLGHGPHLSEALLNHVEIHSHLSSIYNTARYGKEVAEALQLWADALDLVVAGDAATIELLR